MLRKSAGITLVEQWTHLLMHNQVWYIKNTIWYHIAITVDKAAVILSMVVYCYIKFKLPDKIIFTSFKLLCVLIIQFYARRNLNHVAKPNEELMIVNMLIMLATVCQKWTYKQEEFNSNVSSMSRLTNIKTCTYSLIRPCRMCITIN